MDRTVIKLDELRRFQTIEHYSGFLIQSMVEYSKFTQAVGIMLNDDSKDNINDVMLKINQLGQNFPLVNDAIGKLITIINTGVKIKPGQVEVKPDVPKDIPKKNGNIFNLFTGKIIE